MITIYKYPFEIEDEICIVAPAGAEPLHVAIQHDIPCLWMRMDTDKPMVQHTFRLAGTGHDLGASPEATEYVGSFFACDGVLVFHLFKAN